jgi:Xaa-Pro aminopeptidase
MKRAAQIASEAHIAAMRATRPGGTENAIEGELLCVFRRHGAVPAYEPIVGAGANACVLHYRANNAPLKDGDLLLIDAGAEVDCYASDVTRTFPVNGRFSAAQRAVYSLVLAAQKAAIDAAVPGASWIAPHEAAVEVLTEGMLSLGLLKGTLAQCLKDHSYRRFYMHKTGHWLGLDVHDCGVYHVRGSSRKLEPGMVTTVEPGLYVAPDDETVEPRWRGIGIRIEDDVLVTSTGNEVLTAAIPKTVKDVEAACRGKSALQPVS